jgi:hypothetical protein
MLNKMKQLGKTARRTLKYQIRDLLNRKNIFEETSYRDILDTIRNQGYYVAEGYYSPEKCTELRDEIDYLIEEFRDDIFIDDQASDHRIFGADRVSDRIREFYTDSFILEIAELYHKAEILNFCTMANKVIYQADNLGSGGGWHRDTIHQRQFKSILYLSDVEEEQGAFQYLPGTHSLISPFQVIWEHDQDYGHTRFTEEEIESIFEDGTQTCKTLTGKAGTMILVDTSGIHRGRPIKSGTRYALTNYIYATHALDDFTANKLEKLCVVHPS